MWLSIQTGYCICRTKEIELDPPPILTKAVNTDGGYSAKALSSEHEPTSLNNRATPSVPGQVTHSPVP